MHTRKAAETAQGVQVVPIALQGTGPTPTPMEPDRLDALGDSNDPWIRFSEYLMGQRRVLPNVLILYVGLAL